MERNNYADGRGTTCRIRHPYMTTTIVSRRVTEKQPLLQSGAVAGAVPVMDVIFDMAKSVRTVDIYIENKND